MTDGVAGGPRWLDERELACWVPVVRLVHLLPQALDVQLRTDAGISHLYYQLLVVLSDATDRQMRLSELASYTGMSLSRLSRALDSLEGRGWVSRRADPDVRGVLACITDAGLDVLTAMAPSHVDEVRRLVLDRLTPAELEQLGSLAAKIVDGLDPHAGRRPSRRRPVAASPDEGR